MSEAGTVFDFHGPRADATVVEYLKPFRQYLDLPDVTEVCVNRPDELFVERAGAWQRTGEDAVLQRCYAGLLLTPQTVSAPEAAWVICRTAELLEWKQPTLPRQPT